MTTTATPNATSGANVWSFPTRFEVVSSPAVYNDTVYVATDSTTCGCNGQ
jgi:outer membrane protein assembly factor BamB